MPLRRYLILFTALLFVSPVLATEIPGRECVPATCCTCVSLETLPLSADLSSVAQSMQHGASQSMQDMPKMDMGRPESLIDTILIHASSGTSVEPISTPHDML